MPLPQEEGMAGPPMRGERIPEILMVRTQPWLRQQKWRQLRRIGDGSTDHRNVHWPSDAWRRWYLGPGSSPWRAIARRTTSTVTKMETLGLEFGRSVAVQFAITHHLSRSQETIRAIRARSQNRSTPGQHRWTVPRPPTHTVGAISHRSRDCKSCIG